MPLRSRPSRLVRARKPNADWGRMPVGAGNHRGEGIEDVILRLLHDGFGGSRSGEDPFDATIACIGLARLLLDDAVPEPPESARAVEGWILGLPGEAGAPID